MGDPKKLRKKYSTPSHPWQKLRIDEEKELTREFGFKNKKEIWKLNSKLQAFKIRVKKLITQSDEQSEKDKVNLVLKLQKLGVISSSAVLEDILSVNLREMCGRRLPTILVKKGLARSVKQARQFITHEHILVGTRKITFPSYLVDTDEELMIRFADNSNLSNEDHPERTPADTVVKEEQKKAGLDKKDKKVESNKEFVEKTAVVKEEKPIVEKIEEEVIEKPSEDSPVEDLEKEIKADEAVVEEAPKEEAPKEEAPKEEAPKEEAPKEEAPTKTEEKVE
jgi:small subunit ribosomal protein S4